MSLHNLLAYDQAESGTTALPGFSTLQSLKFLEENEVGAWSDLPVWLGGMDLVVDFSRALKDFPVSFHSFNDSLKGCIEYYSSLGWPEPKTGLPEDRETALLEKLATKS